MCRRACTQLRAGTNCALSQQVESHSQLQYRYIISNYPTQTPVLLSGSRLYRLLFLRFTNLSVIYCVPNI